MIFWKNHALLPKAYIWRWAGAGPRIATIQDDSVINKKVTINLEKVSVQKAIEAILKSTESQVRMKDDHTLLIFADTPENREKYADLKSWL